MKRLVIGQDDLVGPWICARTGGEWIPGSVTIGMARDGVLIAGVLFDNWNGRSMAMHVAAEGAGWLSREYLRAAFRYAFVQMKVSKLLGLVDETNAAARRFDEHLGFRLEARIADAAPKGDLLIYSMTPAECRFLEA